MRPTGQRSLSASLTSKNQFPRDLLNGHHHVGVAHVDISLKRLPTIPLTTNVTTLMHPQYHHPHVDAHHHPSPSPCQQDHTRTDYDPELVGHSLDHSFKALGLGLGATETEVKVRYRALARIYHPDKHDPTRTGLSHEAAADYFKLINNAQAYLSEVL